MRCQASQITYENLAHLNREDAPILVACLHLDIRLQDHIRSLQSLADSYKGRLSVYYALEDMFPFFRERHSVMGTPTFLVLKDGGILGSILGNPSFYDLTDQVGRILQDYHDGFQGIVPEDRNRCPEPAEPGKWTAT